jgi:hypothetical protein
MYWISIAHVTSGNHPSIDHRCSCEAYQRVGTRQSGRRGEPLYSGLSELQCRPADHLHCNLLLSLLVVLLLKV